MKNKRILFQALITVIFLPLHGWTQPAEDYAKYSAAFPNEPVVFVADEENLDIELKKTGLEINSKVHRDLFLMDDKGSIYSQDYVRFSGWTPLVDINAATMIPNGKSYKTETVKDYSTNDVMSDDIFYNDTKERTFYYPSVVKGSHMVLDYTLNISEPRFLPSFYFGAEYPTAHTKYTVNCPADVELEILYFNTTAEALNFNKTVGKSSVTYSWEMNNIPKIPTEPDAPSIQYYTPQVMVYIKSYKMNGEQKNLISGLDDLYKFYYNYIKDVNKGDDETELKNLVDSLTNGITDRDQKAEKIFSWVQGSIKYIAFEAGMDGFVPRPAEKICTNKYGDCKDMANLTHELLNLAGIPAYLCWIGTRDIAYSYSKVPTPLSDNHMICAYKGDNGYIFLDATASYLPFGLPSPFIQGKEALIGIDSSHYELVKVPEVEADKNLLEEKIDLQYKNGILYGKGLSRYTGFTRMHFQSIFDNVNPLNKMEIMDQIYEEGNNTYQLDSIQESYPENNDNEMFVAVKFNLKNYVKETPENLFINLSLVKDLSRDKVKDDRTIPVEYTYKQVMDRTITFAIPEGYKVDYIPDQVDYVADEFEWHITYTANGSQVVRHSTLKIKSLLLEKKDFTKWNEMIKKMNSAYNETIILKKS